MKKIDFETRINMRAPVYKRKLPFSPSETCPEGEKRLQLEKDRGCLPTKQVA